jgi:ParB family chromosome partitioning protein
LKLPSHFAKKISEALSMAAQSVEELFEIYEDKQGFFIAKLRPKQWLDKAQFKTMCALARDLGGEGYLQGAKAWMVPGPCAKKADTTSTPEDARSKTEPSGVTPRSVTDDKSKPPDIPNIKFIPVDAIEVPNFLPTRELIQHEKLAQIRDSIKKRGLKYAIRVRHVPPDAYELIDGYLRLKAVRELSWKEIPAEIVTASDQDVVIDSIITNKDRIEEDSITVAKKLDILLNVFGYTQEKLAEEIGLDRTKIAHTIRLLKLPKEVQHSVALHNVSFYHALLLLTLEDPQLQVQLATEVVDNGLSTRQLEERIRELQPKPIAPSTLEPPQLEPATQARRAMQPEGRASRALPEPSTRYPPIPSESTTSTPLKEEPTETPKPKPLLTGFEVECPECHVKLLINHVDHPNGKVSHEVEE